MQAKEASVEARDALGTLCEVYWNPVFEFVRREGRTSEESQELTQEFFKRILEGGLGNVRPDKSRFRSYLLGAVKHFLADAKRDQATIRRGGAVEIHSIESSGSGTSPGLQIADPAQPDADALFDRAWALALIERGLLQVQLYYEKLGKTEQFDVLKPWLMGNSTELSVASAAVQLALSPNAVTVAIHRLRKNFRMAIQEELSVTLTNSDDLDEELTYLIRVLS
jgi:RNA polymerase sigma-70 factor (ECF subfamily)